jgi:uncharacterized protein
VWENNAREVFARWPGTVPHWDITKDRKIIRGLAWPKDASLIVLDELHKAPKWKNLLKGVVDEFGNKPPVLVAGSARLDAFRRAGDALTGRTYVYRLHPIDVAESRQFLSDSTLEERIRRLLEAGGFPEAFLNPKEAARLRNDRMELVTREDLRDQSLERGIVPPTMHLDYVPDRARSGIALRAVMSNSFAFGGTNATLIAAIGK